MRNRKVSRPAPVRPAPPKNVRVASKRAAASNRLTFWIAVMMFTGCAAEALVWVRIFLTEALRFESFILVSVSMGFLFSIGLVGATIAWRDLYAVRLH